MKSVCLFLSFIHLSILLLLFFCLFSSEASFKERLQLMKKQLSTIRKWQGMNNVYLNFPLL